MPIRNDKRLFHSSLVTAIALAVCAATVAAQVSQTAPAPDRNIGAPAPQAHQPQAGRQPLPPGTRVPQPVMQAPGAGTIEGFVYWDTSTFIHTPPSSCAGLSLTISVANGLGGPFQGGFTALPTVTNNFKYVGQVKTFQSGGKVLTYDVCTYGYDHVPVGPRLKVEIGSSGVRSFSPIPSPQPPLVGPITIINGQCNMLPHITNPTSSDLTAHWGSCQNTAYNVNFVLQPSNFLQVQSANVGGAPPSGAGSQRGMLASGPQQGMLATGSTQSTQPSSSSGTLLGNPQSMPAQVGGVQNPGNTAALNPQPFPPGPGGHAGARNSTLPGSRRIAVTLSSPKQGSKITNPKAALRDGAIIAVLQQQRKAADAESSAMKLGIRPAGVQSGTTPSQIMAANSGAQRTAPAPNQNSALASSTQHPALGVALPAQFNTLALTCSHDPSMRALTVSGGPAPVIFTPDPKYNFYTIIGCSFGSPGTNSKAYIYYQGTFREDFQIQQWTDNFIQLSLDQNIGGVDDQNNVTLVIQRDDGKQWTKNSYKFYAARQTVLLSSIPRSDFSLNKFRPDNAVVASWTPTYTSASSASVVPNLPGLSGEVHWDIIRDPKGAPLGGQDNYDFSHLHSTFALDSASMEWRDVSCTDPNYNQFATSKNNWSIDWYGNSGVQVSWQGQVCNNTWRSCGTGWPVKSDCFEGMPESNYGVNVWVAGPRGLDPWTGKPIGN